MTFISGIVPGLSTVHQTGCALLTLIAVADCTKVGLTVSACACIEKKNDDTNKLAANFFWKNVIIKNTTQIY